jgi:glycosyltransferase involved in cell wall biosynthesis
MKMRLLLVSNTGYQYFLPAIAPMESRGAEVLRVSTDELRTHQKRFASAKSRIVRTYYFDRPVLAAFRKTIEEFSPDVVHVTGLRSTLILALTAIRVFPHIPIVHERISAAGMNPLSPLDWTLFSHPRITRIIMPSRAMLNNWMGHPYLRRLIPPDICEVLHYPLELPAPVDDAGRRALRRSLGVDENAFVIGTACYVRPWKNLEFVADIVSSIDARAPLCFVVIGPDSPNRPYMDRLQAAGGERIKFLGYRQDAVGLMAALDLYVTPTHLPGESFGMAFAEAMSHGVAGLTMNFGASAEICEDGESGYALPFRKAAWRDAIEMLMRDRSKLETMGKAARLRIKDRFSPAAIADTYLAFYERVRADGPVRRLRAG